MFFRQFKNFFSWVKAILDSVEKFTDFENKATYVTLLLL